MKGITQLVPLSLLRLPFDRHCPFRLPFDIVDIADNDNMPELIVLNVGGSQRHHQVSKQKKTFL